jgi:succinylglutamate desuccinylase
MAQHPPTNQESDRTIGTRHGSQAGPAVVAVGGVHGTEPAGTLAADRVLARLDEVGGLRRGSFTALRGNLGALAAGRRYLDIDLNRIWQPELVDRIRRDGTPPDAPAEHVELAGLLAELDRALAESEGPGLVLDLHTTSSDSVPFIWLIACVDAQATLEPFGLPCVHDPAHRISGTLGHHVARSGHRVVVVEGGRHDAADAVDHHEAAIWIALAHAGLIDGERADDERQRAHDRLHDVTAGLPGLFQTVHHHKVADDDAFVMRPGYASFQPVAAGEHLADDARGEIHATRSGYVLMPLYVPPCDDGFVLVEARTEWPDLAAEGYPPVLPGQAS